jgi:hypothetical protein
MSEYTGSRRVAPTAPSPDHSTDVANLFAEDDDALTCPQCGAAVRPGQEWCTLCLHVLRTPEPEPVSQPVAAEAAEPAAPPEPAAEVEAVASAMLEALAIESRKEGFGLPSFLQSKAQRWLAIAVGMAVFSVVAVVALAVLGALTR